MIVAMVLSVLVLALAGLLRAALASLIRTHRADALHDAHELSGADIAARLLEHRTGLQPAIGLVHSGMLIAAALLAAWGLTTAGIRGVMLAGALALTGVIVVSVGEAIPRSIGRSHPRLLAYRFAWLLKLARSVGKMANDLVTDDELDSVTEGHDEDDHQEIRLISSILDFSATLLREVMVPRTDMVTVEVDGTSEQALRTIITHGFSRIPVTGEGTDDIRGIVYAKDLLRLMDEGASPVPISEILRPAYFVPETKRVSDMLRDMQGNQTHMAVVVDEFGGTSGIVTIEDILEEIVGEIVDEYDREDPMVIAGPDGSWLVDGRLDVDELGDLVEADLPDEDWDTVGGLVLGLAGRVPREGESFDVGHITITAVRVQGRRVSKVRVARHDEMSAPEVEAD
ncbi:MAG: HlyC/CorC family transporter [Acidimicrobiia bacterium]|nr:HlyC/CorC family transporter [Acidimicrobiia bacterium]